MKSAMRGAPGLSLDDQQNRDEAKAAESQERPGHRPAEAACRLALQSKRSVEVVLHPQVDRLSTFTALTRIRSPAAILGGVPGRLIERRADMPPVSIRNFCRFQLI